MTVYNLGDEGTMNTENRLPDILCEGDSWFSYPLLPTGNLINQYDYAFPSDRTYSGFVHA